MVVLVQENFATVLETVADVRADRTAVTHGDRSVTWRQLDDRSSRLAGFLAGRGIGADARVAIALYNGIEYLESVFAILKLGAIPVNVNYRYQPDEMRHLFDDAQVSAVIFDASLAERVGAAQAGAQAARTMVQVGGAAEPPGAPVSGAAAPPGAPVSGYEQVIGATAPLPRAARDVGRWLMYTGGTTGKPKGVLVSHAWLYPVVSANGFVLIGEPVPGSLDALRATTERLSARGDAIVCLPAPPLMHATGMYTSLGALLASGRVVYLTQRSYDADELARIIPAQQVDTVSIVGDVFALPLADALDQAAQVGHPYDVSSLRRILSACVRTVLSETYMVAAISRWLR